MKRPAGQSRASSRKQQRRNRRIQETQAVGTRNVHLDTLRGLAIVLMVVDHIADLFFQTPIEYSTIRFATRLSMPLFALLMGYFFLARRDYQAGDQAVASPRRIYLNRLFQIVLAAVATNLLYFTARGVVDILADLAICYAIFLLIGSKFAYCYFALLFYPYDPTAPYFDYRLTLVLSLVAQGAILRRMGMGPAVASAILLTVVGLILVEQPSVFVLQFSLPATLLVGWAAQSKGISHPWLAFLGRYPLTVYVAQYYVLFGIAKYISAMR